MDEEKDKKIYELALLLKSESDAARVLELVRQHNGETVSEPRIKKLALAYKIKGMTEAMFMSYVVRMTGEDAKQIERDLGMREEIIRFLVLVAPPQAERQPLTAPPFPLPKRGRPPVEARPPVPSPLSNEALEKKIEEISQ
ncbi:MAG: 30S ribosomal protein S6 [Minisyncoccia bacterium]|jgi:ribosomal protein S6